MRINRSSNCISRKFEFIPLIAVQENQSKQIFKFYRTIFILSYLFLCINFTRFNSTDLQILNIKAISSSIMQVSHRYCGSWRFTQGLVNKASVNGGIFYSKRNLIRTRWARMQNGDFYEIIWSWNWSEEMERMFFLLNMYLSISFNCNQDKNRPTRSRGMAFLFELFRHFGFLGCSAHR